MVRPNYQDDWVKNTKKWTIDGGGVDMPKESTLKFDGDGTDASKGTLTVTPHGGSPVSPPWSTDCVYQSDDSVTLTHKTLGYTITRDEKTHTLTFKPGKSLVAGYGASWTATEG